MKKRTIVALIVAVCLIISGGILVVMGFSSAKEGIQTPVLTERTVPLNDNFDYIAIVTTDCDVQLHLVQTWEEARVEFREFSQAKHTVAIQDENLEIELTDHRKWFDKIGIFWEDMQIDLYLPYEQRYTHLFIKTDTGDINLPPYIITESLNLYSDTGDIYTEVRANSVSVEANTGEVIVCACDPNFVHVKTDTGNIVLSGLKGTGNYTIQTDTGDMHVSDIKCGNIACESDTGDVHFWIVQAEETLKIVTGSGDVEVGNSEAQEVNIESSTGDITVPAAWEFQRIETGTGKIKFE